MPQSADIGSKRLISLDPQSWVRWITGIPLLQAREVLSGEFQWISRESDVLIRVQDPDLGEFLVLTELQLNYRSNMPERMTAYAALAREKYKLPVLPVLINILPTGSEIPTCYESSFLNVRAIQDYRVINLWEVSVELVFEQPLPGLLPFVPILDGGADPQVIERAVGLLRQEESLSDFEPLLGFFASFVLELPLIQQILRWDMAVLRESPIYQEAIQRGIQLGKQEGIQLGKQEGKQEGIQLGKQEAAAEVAVKMLAVGMDPDLIASVTGLPLERIRQLQTERP